MKIPRHDAIKRNTYFTNTSLLLYFSAPGERQLCIKPNAILRRERNGDNSPRTTRIYYSNTFYIGKLVPWLFLGDGGWIEIVSETRRQFTSVDSSIVKGPIRLRDSRGQNLAADTNSCERLYQAQF